MTPEPQPEDTPRRKPDYFLYFDEKERMYRPVKIPEYERSD